MNIIEAKDIKKYFPVKKSFFKREEKVIKALDGIDFVLGKGKISSLVGETGSGKTTFGRILVGLTPPTSGTVKIEGVDISNIKRKEMRDIRKKIQIIFQDPFSSLNPRMKVKNIVEEPLKLNHIEFDEEKIIKVLEDVDLKPASDFLNRYPHELSGGQRQRVAIARALAIAPEFIVADEPVSMLDVSIRANFLNLIKKLNSKYNVSLLMITHDISIAAYIGEEISILYLGKIIERGMTKEVINNPLHPYTVALMDAIPTLGKKDKEIRIKGDIPNPIDIPPGCRFSPRCPAAMEVCKQVEPELKEMAQGHFVACHLYT
ncbi:MAG: ATP-binding cassette domain-containing protein [Candidatus Parvarchaeota archaeon]